MNDTKEIYLYLLTFLLCSVGCQTQDDGMMSEPQKIGGMEIAHAGYTLDDSKRWNVEFLLRNPTQNDIEFSFGSTATGLPSGTQSVLAKNIEIEDMPALLSWRLNDTTKIDILMLKRYGLATTQVLAAGQINKIKFPIYVTPDLPDQTRNLFFINFGADSDSTYVAELKL